MRDTAPVPQIRYITPDVSKWTALLEYRGLPNQAKVLLSWLVLQASPRTGAVETTIVNIAAALSWHRTTVTRALDQLVDAGMVEARFPPGRHAGGSVTVLAYYDVMAPTKWLNRQRAIGTPA